MSTLILALPIFWNSALSNDLLEAAKNRNGEELTKIVNLAKDEEDMSIIVNATDD